MPTNSVDTPISAVFIFLFIVTAVLHMAVLQVNMKRDHKFIFSGLLFGLSMARITALVMRIVWANRTSNVDIAITANVFTNAGVVILFIVNILFAKRIVRGYHPKLGHLKAYERVFSALVLLIVAILFVLIGVTVSSFFTLDVDRRLAFRDIQRFAGCFFAVLAFLPIPLVLLAMVWPRHAELKKFGTGRWRTKLALLVGSSALLTVGAGFRAGISFKTRPQNDPAWYHSKACYYCFIFLIEIIVSFLYGLMRFDKRFHYVPPTAAKGDEEDGSAAAEDGERTRRRSGSRPELGQVRSFESRVNTEAQAFGDDSGSSGEDGG